MSLTAPNSPEADRTRLDCTRLRWEMKAPNRTVLLIPLGAVRC